MRSRSRGERGIATRRSGARLGRLADAAPLTRGFSSLALCGTDPRPVSLCVVKDTVIRCVRACVPMRVSLMSRLSMGDLSRPLNCFSCPYLFMVLHGRPLTATFKGTRPFGAVSPTRRMRVTPPPRLAARPPPRPTGDRGLDRRVAGLGAAWRRRRAKAFPARLLTHSRTPRPFPHRPPRFFFAKGHIRPGLLRAPAVRRPRHPRRYCGTGPRFPVASEKKPSPQPSAQPSPQRRASIRSASKRDEACVAAMTAGRDTRAALAGVRGPRRRLVAWPDGPSPSPRPTPQ